MQGENPYAVAVPHGYRAYPLTLATLLIPLSELPMGVAQVSWFALNGAALVVSLKIVEELWTPATGTVNAMLSTPFIVRLATLVLAVLVPLKSHFAHGQVNLVVLVLCCLFLRAFLADRRLAAATWLGGAIAIKLTPLVFLVSLMREGALRTLVLTGGSVLLWTVGLPTLVSGRVLALYRGEWWGSVRPYLEAPVTFSRASRFTLVAALADLWPGFARVPGLQYWAAAAVLAPILWIQGQVGRDERGRLVLFALYLLAALLISPLSETHHLSLLVVPLWVWLLAIGEAPRVPTVDLVAATLFLALHWLAVWHRETLLDFLGLVVLYVVLLKQGMACTFTRSGRERADRPARDFPDAGLS